MVVETSYNNNCYDVHRFEDILFTLPMRKFHQTYHAEDHGVCYQNAVFGTLTGKKDQSTAIEANQHIFKGTHSHSFGSWRLISPTL